MIIEYGISYNGASWLRLVVVKVRDAVANRWKEHGPKVTWMPAWTQEVPEPQDLFSFHDSKMTVS